MILRDTDVDRFGRMVFAGMRYRDDEDATDLYLSRLNAEGAFDSSFGAGGAVLSTAKGVKELLQVVARTGGGYVAAGRTAGGTRLIAFDERGRIDRDYGRDGVVPLDNLLDVKLLEQPDGKLISAPTHPAAIRPATTGSATRSAS